MELARNKERVDGIAEYEEVRLPDGFQRGGKVLLQHLDSLPGIQIIELVPGKLLFQKKARMQRNGILPLGAAVDDKDIIHSFRGWIMRISWSLGNRSAADHQAFRYSEGVRPVWALKNLKKTDWLGKWSL